jgi:hypothetical protein
MTPLALVTAATILTNAGVQLVDVNGATRISPSWMSRSCATSSITRATPSAIPGDPDTYQFISE